VSLCVERSIALGLTLAQRGNGISLLIDYFTALRVYNLVDEIDDTERMIDTSARNVIASNRWAEDLQSIPFMERLMSQLISLEKALTLVGTEVGVTDWLEISQERVNQFADATGDHQFIHIDVERAKAETSFGGTIAHGYLTLSLLPMLSAQTTTVRIEGTRMSINYGLDKVRFINPVLVGKRIRARFELVSVEEKKPGNVLIKHKVTVEIEGADKPAMIAESLGMAII
jgi:acyl dehydratase